MLPLIFPEQRPTLRGIFKTTLVTGMLYFVVVMVDWSQVWDWCMAQVEAISFLDMKTVAMVTAGTTAAALGLLYAVIAILMVGTIVVLLTQFFLEVLVEPIIRRREDGKMKKLLHPTAAPEDEVCVVCRDDFEDAVELPCQHVFCDGCIRLALRMRSACPLCSRCYCKEVSS